MTVKAEIVYADNGVVASTDPGWLQSALDLLTGIFDRVELCTNVRKTVGMVFQPCRASGLRADKAYNRRMTGEGKIFKEQQREKVLCLECGKDLYNGSLVTHRQTQHGVAKGRLASEEDEADRGGDKPRIYKMVFPKREGPRPCPVNG